MMQSPWILYYSNGIIAIKFRKHQIICKLRQAYYSPAASGDTESAFVALQGAGMAETKRTAERRLHELGLLAPEVTAASLRDEWDREPNRVVFQWALERARSRRHLVLFVQLHRTRSGAVVVHANDARNARFWIELADEGDALAALVRLQQYSASRSPCSPMAPWSRRCAPIRRWSR